MKEWKCQMCGDIFDEDELICMKEWHESFYRSGDTFICPDCLDRFEHMDAEDQVELLLNQERSTT